MFPWLAQMRNVTCGIFTRKCWLSSMFKELVAFKVWNCVKCLSTLITIECFVNSFNFYNFFGLDYSKPKTYARRSTFWIVSISTWPTRMFCFDMIFKLYFLSWWTEFLAKNLWHELFWYDQDNSMAQCWHFICFSPKSKVNILCIYSVVYGKFA